MSQRNSINDDNDDDLDFENLRIDPIGIGRIELLPITQKSKLNPKIALANLGNNDMRSFLQQICSVEVRDYSPLKRLLKEIERIVRGKFWTNVGGEYKCAFVQVVPRGSFYSRTGILSSVDLDIDLILDENFEITAGRERKKLIEFLKVDEDMEITWEGLKKVLQSVYRLLDQNQSCEEDPNGQCALVPSNGITSVLKLTKPLNKVTRSLSMITLGKIKMGSNEAKQIGVDIFIKIRRVEELSSRVFIIGSDKVYPDQKIKSTVTQFLPTKGNWETDEPLSPAPRFALLYLKWWKTVNESQIKSHHLMMAIKALHLLDKGDPLYVPEHRSMSVTCAQILEVMYKALNFLRNAYNPEMRYLVQKQNDPGHNEFPVLRLAWSVQESLFYQMWLSDNSEEHSSYPTIMNHLQEVLTDVDVKYVRRNGVRVEKRKIVAVPTQSSSGSSSSSRLSIGSSTFEGETKKGKTA